MGRAAEDLIGQVFGHLTVEGVARRGKSVTYNCQCSCGDEATVKSCHLRSGQKTHCGCKRQTTEDLRLKQYGDLVVSSYAGVQNGKHYWFCKCKCGNTSLSRASDLKSGHTKTCGNCTKQQKPLTPKAKGKHGATNTPEFKAWSDLGAQRVVGWDDFVQFFCDVGERPSPQHRLARRDGTKPHGPTNTYWRNADDDAKLTATDLGDEFVLDLRSLCLAEAAAREGEASA